jgi:hypothetical protein
MDIDKTSLQQRGFADIILTANQIDALKPRYLKIAETFKLLNGNVG